MDKKRYILYLIANFEAGLLNLFLSISTGSSRAYLHDTAGCANAKWKRHIRSACLWGFIGLALDGREIIESILLFNIILCFSCTTFLWDKYSWAEKPTFSPPRQYPTVINARGGMVVTLSRYLSHTSQSRLSGDEARLDQNSERPSILSSPSSVALYHFLTFTSDMLKLLHWLNS
jgi:hypothetical protein